MRIEPLDLLEFDESGPSPEPAPTPGMSCSPMGILVGAVLSHLRKEEERPALPNIRIHVPEEFGEFEIRIRYR